MDQRSRLIGAAILSLLAPFPTTARGATLSASPVIYSAQGNALATSTATFSPGVTVILGAEYVENDSATLTISGGNFATGIPSSVSCTNTTNGAVITFTGLTRSTTSAQYRVTQAPSSGVTVKGAACNFVNPILRRSATAIGNVSLAWSARVGVSSTLFDVASGPVVVATIIDQFPAPSNVTPLNGIVDTSEGRYQFVSGSDDNLGVVGTQDRLTLSLNNVSTAGGAALIDSIVTTISGDFSFIDNNGTAGCQSVDLTSGHGRITRVAGTGTLSIDSTCSTLTYTTATAETVSIDLGTANPRGTTSASTWRVLTAPQNFSSAVRYRYGSLGTTATDDRVFTAGSWTLSNPNVGPPPTLSELEVLRYVASHPDLIAAFGTDIASARKHFEDFGWREGRSITFDPNVYLALHVDLSAAFGSDLAAATRHYIQWGFREGRAVTATPTVTPTPRPSVTPTPTSTPIPTSTLTDLQVLAYIASHPDLIAAFGTDIATARKHYQDYGSKEGRQINFDPTVYLALHADLKSAFGNDLVAATRHYIEFGFREGRATIGTITLPTSTPTPRPSTILTPTPTSTPTRTATPTPTSLPSVTLTDLQVLTYIASHPDLIAAFGTDIATARKHYQDFGSKEGRQITFDPSAYLAFHGDLKAVFGTDLVAATRHYIEFGFREGRATGRASETPTPTPRPSTIPTPSVTPTPGVTPTTRPSSTPAPVLTSTPTPTRTVTLTDQQVLNYIASHPDLIAAFGTDIATARKHYEDFGSKEGRAITFDPNVYLALHADLQSVFGSDLAAATRHYIQFGFREGRATTPRPTSVPTPSVTPIPGVTPTTRPSMTPTPVPSLTPTPTRTATPTPTPSLTLTDLQVLAYIASHADLIESFGTDIDAARRHYRDFGATEGRQITFDPSVYLSLHADLRTLFGNDLAAATRHYIEFGFREGRATTLTVTPTPRPSTTPSPTRAPTSSPTPPPSVTTTPSPSPTPRPTSLPTSTYSLRISILAESPSPGAALRFSNPNAGGFIADFKKPNLLKVARVFVRLRRADGTLVSEGYTDDAGEFNFSGLDPAVAYRLGVASAALTPDGLSVWVVNNRLPVDASAQKFRDRYLVHWSYVDLPAGAGTAGALLDREWILKSGYNTSTRTFDDGARVSGPFLILNYLVQHQAFLAAAGAPAKKLPDLTILWSTSNRAAGDTSTYSFDQGIAGSSGAFFGTQTGPISMTGIMSQFCPCTDQDYIFLSGSQATEPMELTSAVSVHEATHFTQRNSMRNASPGGPHTTQGEWQDFTLAQHEGFATGNALMIANSSIDGRILALPSQFQSSYDAGFYIAGTDYKISKNSTEGWFQEGSFTALIWRLFDPAGSIRLPASKIIAPFYSATWTDGIWAPSPWAYGSILKSQNTSLSSDIDTLAASLNITLAGNDVWGTNERILGNRTFAQTFPIFTTVPLTGSVTVCSVGAKAEYNKLSNRRYLRFEGNGTPRTIRITGDAGTVPLLYVDNPRTVNALSKGATSVERRLTIPAGGTYGWVGDCAVTYSASEGVINSACASSSYTPPAQTCWTISVSN